MEKKNYIKPNYKVINLSSNGVLTVSFNKRGYAIDNYNADDDKIINVERQTTDYFTTDFMELN